ncbi:hypothetical protein BH20ACT2_BH20ACT2_08110 [soil metagenome]
MVRWLDPHQLLDTAARVVLSGTFSSYADSRELQAFVAVEVADRSGPPEMWLDYVADLGDGWNSTYTVARLLATEGLKLDWNGRAVPTERGSILVMGGDQVYPVPNRTEYENRLLGPYRSALPCARGESPELFAIPGSHDWYDGLINFTSVFCRSRSIGGWRTRQTRSYFALKLPHGWWLWGIDLQFGSHLDEAQLQYFSDVAVDGLAEGDRVILCMAKEVDSGRDDTEIYSDRDLAYLEREVIEPNGAFVAVYLKSGRHHYCRYEEEGGARHVITAGGGGAFLHPTHQLPERIDPPGVGEAGSYQRAATYPTTDVSKRLRKRTWLLPLYNLPLAGVFAGVHVLLAFMLGLHLGDRHRALGFSGLRLALWESPTAFLLVLLMIITFGAMVRFAHDANGVSRVLLGLVHSSLQCATLAGVMLGASRLASALGLGGAPSLLVFLAFVGLLGGAASTVGVAGYLWATNCLGLHGNEAYAPLHHMDLKNFLRLHIDREGTLTLYPVGIDRVGRRWKLCPDAPAHAPWFAPAGADATPRLIEAPIRITRDGSSDERSRDSGR